MTPFKKKKNAYKGESESKKIGLSQGTYFMGGT